MKQLEIQTDRYKNTKLVRSVNYFVLISMKNEKPRPRGRPRAFDRDAVLDRAVTTFWARGYSGASVDDLTGSMGINRPSLYATFGSKHDLFLEVIDRYASTFGGMPFSAFKSNPDAKSAVAAFLEASIHCATTKGKPRGCLIANVAIFEAEKDTQVKQKVSGLFADTDQAISEYFSAAQDDGRLSDHHDPRALARMVISITHSIATRARAGASREQLSVVADDFMATLFPASNEYLSGSNS